MDTTPRQELVTARNVLTRRRTTTADPAEQAAIDDAITAIDDSISLINQVSLLEAAQMVSGATDALERVVASVRMGPFDQVLGDLQDSIAHLQGQLDTLQGAERLPPAPVKRVAAGLLAATAVPTPINSRKFEDLHDEYEHFLSQCRLRPEFSANAEFYVTRLIRFKPTYLQLGQGLNGIPWAFIGIIHGMECGFNFSTHLHNGDPLTDRTVHVPVGRPAAGSPPFPWVVSARDALIQKKFHLVSDWGLARMLYLLELYNGFGYRPRGVPTPYLWSFSNLYEKGKYVADGRYDPEAVSRQCGAGVMLRGLQERGAL